MNRRLLGLLILVWFAVLACDVGLSLFYVPGYWRPLPPFEAITNETQRAWVERNEREIAEGKPETGWGRFDAELGWSYRPLCASDSGAVHFNSRAARGEREYEALPPADVTRVVSFGDSFTFCQEVTDSETWQAILEASDATLEVLNFGVGGYGTDQALLRARRELPGVKADVALMGLLLENIGRNVNRYRPRYYPNTNSAVAKPRFVLAGAELELIEHPFATRAELVRAVSDGSVIERCGEHEYWDDLYVPRLLRWSAVATLLGGRKAYAERDLALLWSRSDEEPFLVTLALLEEFDRFARSNQARPAVLIFPLEHDVRTAMRDGGGYWTSLTDELERRGIAYLDLSQSIIAGYRARREEEPALYTGAHLSGAGNTIVARSVGAWLAGLDGG